MKPHTDPGYYYVWDHHDAVVGTYETWVYRTPGLWAQIVCRQRPDDLDSAFALHGGLLGAPTHPSNWRWRQLHELEELKAELETLIALET